MTRSSSPAETMSEPELGPWSCALRELLQRFTAFPWPLMISMCQRHGCDARGLTRAEIEAMIPAIALAIASFNDVDDGFRIKRELLLMLRSGPALADDAADD